MYHIKIHELMLNERGNLERQEVSKTEDRVQFQICFKEQRLSETFCTCGNTLSGITEEVKKQA